MVEVAALLTAFAALLASIAWPALIATIIVVFRVQLRSSFEQLPSLIQRAEKAKLGFVEFELSKQANAVSHAPVDRQGRVSPEQVASAAKLEVETKSIPPTDLDRQIERLCVEYELLRQTLPSGYERTSAMNRIMAQMRVIGPSVAGSLDRLKASRSAGHRLAAIAIMQMEPEKADLPWIEGRFANEAPFVFFQAAVLLETLSHTHLLPAADITAIAERAHALIAAFPGVPDGATLDVLESIVGTRN